MSSAAIIALVVAAIAVAVVVVAVARRRSSPRDTGRVRDDRLADAVEEMRTKMDDLGRDLSGALERAEREAKRNRFLSDLGTSIEFDELLDRILDAALEIPGFDAAMVALEESGGPPTVATRGMTPEEEAHPPSAGTSDILPAGSITVSYRYGPGEAANTELIRGGLFMSLVGREGQALGSLALFWRTPRFEPPQERIAALEEITTACIPAIENARRYREARRQSETDALTGFFNQRYFHETLRREAQRAQRYARRMAILILDFDDFKLVNDRVGHLAGDAVLAQVADRLRDQVRSVDIGCRIGGDEFAVILPESTAVDAEQLFERMHAAVETMTIPGGMKVRISAGIAELHQGETAASLFERADTALYRAKELGKNRAAVAPES